MLILKNILDEWGLARTQEVVNREDLSRYFLGTSYPSSYYQNNQASSHAAVAFRELVDYIESMLFDRSGRWLLLQPHEDSGGVMANAGQALGNYYRRVLRRSNFYEVMRKNIINGLMPGRVQCSVFYDGGLNFVSFDSDRVRVCGSSYSTQRAYYLKQMSMMEILATFKMPKGNSRARFQAFRNGQLNSSMAEETEQVLVATVPINEFYFTEEAVKELKSKPDQNWMEVFILCDTEEILVPKSESFQTMAQFPILSFQSMDEITLCQLALPASAVMEYYAKRHAVGTDKQAVPPVRMDLSTANLGAFDLNSGGLIIEQGNARKTEPSVMVGDMRNAQEMWQLMKAEVDRIFKSHLLIQTQIHQVGSFEFHSARLQMLRAVHPLVGGIMDRMLPDLIKRASELLLLHDPQFIGFAEGLDVYFTPKGVDAYIEESETFVQMARLAQTATPFMQMSPESTQMINSDKVVSKLAVSARQSEVLRSPQEVNRMRQQMAQQQQAMQEAQMREQSAHSNEMQAKADATEEGTGAA